MTILLGFCFGLSGLPGDVHAEFFGRLFTTPAERTTMDKIRFAKPEKKKAVKKQTAKAPPPEPPPEVNAFRMDGLVVRRNGPNTAWIDGTRVLHKGRTRQGVTVDPGSADFSGVAINLPTGGDAVRLKPGQAFEPGAARITEGYQAGSGNLPGVKKGESGVKSQESGVRGEGEPEQENDT